LASNVFFSICFIRYTFYPRFNININANEYVYSKILVVDVDVDVNFDHGVHPESNFAFDVYAMQI